MAAILAGRGLPVWNNCTFEEFFFGSETRVVHVFVLEPSLWEYGWWSSCCIVYRRISYFWYRKWCKHLMHIPLLETTVWLKMKWANRFINYLAALIVMQCFPSHKQKLEGCTSFKTEWRIRFFAWVWFEVNLSHICTNCISAEEHTIFMHPNTHPSTFHPPYQLSTLYNLLAPPRPLNLRNLTIFAFLYTGFVGKGQYFARMTKSCSFEGLTHVCVCFGFSRSL